MLLSLWLLKQMWDESHQGPANHPWMIPALLSQKVTKASVAKRSKGYTEHIEDALN